MGEIKIFFRDLRVFLIFDGVVEGAEKIVESDFLKKIFLSRTFRFSYSIYFQKVTEH